jgi:hypothetical protein
MFATKGRRLLLLGGIAVVALVGASLLLMRPGKGQGPEASAGPASSASSAARPVEAPAGSSPDVLGAGPDAALATALGAEPQTTAPEVPGTAGAEVEGAETESSGMESAEMPDGIFERAKYTYRSLGRVDPFESLVSAKDSASRLFAEKLDPEMLTLVGVLTNDGERRALVEDVHGFGYVLKEGDRVLRGRVLSIGEESMKIRHTMYGVTETTTLSLVRKGQGKGLPNDRLR